VVEESDFMVLSSEPINIWRVKFTPRTGVIMELLDDAGVKDVEASARARFETQIQLLLETLLGCTSPYSPELPSLAAEAIAKAAGHSAQWVIIFVKT
jgi:hypothetical protein